MKSEERQLVDEINEQYSISYRKMGEMIGIEEVQFSNCVHKESLGNSEIVTLMSELKKLYGEDYVRGYFGNEVSNNADFYDNLKTFNRETKFSITSVSQKLGLKPYGLNVLLKRIDRGNRQEGLGLYRDFVEGQLMGWNCDQIFNKEETGVEMFIPTRTEFDSPVRTKEDKVSLFRRLINFIKSKFNPTSTETHNA